MKDTRDPQKLYERIIQIKKNNPGMSITTAADVVEVEDHANMNGKLNRKVALK